MSTHPKWRSESSRAKNYCPSERLDYLQRLLHEFNVTNSKDAKRQVLANICCFAYNPINFESLRKLNAMTTLLNSLNENDIQLKEFAISGLCNLCNDPLNMQIIINNNGLHRIHNCLVKNISNENILISSLTLFIFAKDFNHQISESLGLEMTETIEEVLKTNQNKRIENLAKIYIQNQ